jgi:hypothetical protein
MHNFQVGDRVCIRGHWEFPDGTTGVIAEPEPFQVGLAEPGEWQAHRRTTPGRSGPLVYYFVCFDEPTDDGSGDGPYLGGEIEAECLEIVLP